MKNFIPSTILVFWTRLNGSLGSKLSGHLDTSTEASIQKVEKYQKGEIESQQDYRNALDNIYTN